MNEKPFFRESNVWRLIGLVVLIAAGVLAMVAPEAKGFGYETVSVTVPGIIAILGGLLLCFPTIKEAFITWRNPPKTTDEQSGEKQ